MPFKIAKQSFLLAATMALVGAPLAHAHHETDSLPLYPHDKPDVCVENGQQIRVTVKGAQHKGIAKVEFYKPHNKWLKDEYRKVRVPANDAPFRVCINVDEIGTYAVVGYNDLDADRRLDKKWNFKPKEPFGAVNAHKLKKKKIPKFDQVSFEVGPTGIDVELIYVDPKSK